MGLCVCLCLIKNHEPHMCYEYRNMVNYKGTLMSQKHWWELNWNFWIPMDTAFNELFFYFWERQQLPEIETLYKLYLCKGHHILWKLALQSFNIELRNVGLAICSADEIGLALLFYASGLFVIFYCIIFATCFAGDKIWGGSRIH